MQTKSPKEIFNERLNILITRKFKKIIDSSYTDSKIVNYIYLKFLIIDPNRNILMEIFLTLFSIGHTGRRVGSHMHYSCVQSYYHWASMGAYSFSSLFI